MTSKLASYGFALLFAGLALIAAQWGLANLAYLKADNNLNVWSDQGEVISLDSMKAALQGIDRALDMHPQHPHYLTIKAQLHEWRGYSGIDPSVSAQQDYRTALEYYRKAIKQRPLWPNSYADFAMTKWRLNEWDQEMRWAILAADEFGPFTPEVHKALVMIGFEQWRQQPGVRPDYLQRHVERAAQNPVSRRELDTYLANNKIPRLVACRWLQGSHLRACK